MLFRNDGDAVIAISQPSHAWLSGQIVRAWGRSDFLPPEPFEEVCLGAALHDIGWLEWEAAPTLNAETRLPHSFHQLGPQDHTRLWTRGVRDACTFGLYAGLLVSLHADTIYGRYFNFDKASPEDAATVRTFLDGQHAFQREAMAKLAAQPRYAACATEVVVDRQRRLIGAADHMSLAICGGILDEKRIPKVPKGEEGEVDLLLRAPQVRPDQLTCTPWPFAEDRVSLLCEGRRLSGRFDDEAAMQAALRAAPSVTLVTDLRPG